MNSSTKIPQGLNQESGIELALLIIVLFGFWEFTLSSWPFNLGEFGDLWPILSGQQTAAPWIHSINLFAQANVRLLELIPTLIAEVCLISYVLKRQKAFLVSGCLALLLFSTALHLTNFSHPNHPYYDFFMLGIFVMARGSLPSLRVGYALTYFLCSLLKINEGWITGSFFLAVDGYLPFVPNSAVPYLTNLMIWFQMLGCFLLLSNHLTIRRLAAILFLSFHLYAVIIAGSRFSWSTFPFLVLLYMLDQQSDRPLESSKNLRDFFAGVWSDIQACLAKVTLGAKAVVIAFLLLQILSYSDFISEKRTFNMFSEATSCVITIATENTVTQYGHPIGSNACFEDRIVESARKDFCNEYEDFDLRVEISKNASEYKVVTEFLSVCKLESIGNFLPPKTSTTLFQTQSFISPFRSDERVSVLVNDKNQYVFKPDVASSLLRDHWGDARMLETRENLVNAEGELFVEIAYKYILLIIWLLISALLVIHITKKG